MSLTPARSQGVQHGARSVEMRAEFAFYQGVLPPPEMLERFETLCPGATDRFLKMAERQAEHRHGIEKDVVHGNLHAQRAGVRWAGSIVVIAMAIGGWLLHEGRDTAGFASLFGPLGTVAALFLYTRWKDVREQAKKRARAMTQGQQPPRLPPGAR